MNDILLLLIGAVLVNSLLLTPRPAVYPFEGAMEQLHAVFALAAATSVVLITSSIATYFIYRFLLLPFDVVFLRNVTYMLVIVIMGNPGAITICKTLPEFTRLPALFLPLITTNAAILGVMLINDNKAGTFAESVLYASEAATGFSLLLILFSALRERLTSADVPEPFRGPGITLITAGLISLAFMGFAGLA